MKTCGHVVLYALDFAKQCVPVRPDGCLICEKDELESKLASALERVDGYAKQYNAAQDDHAKVVASYASRLDSARAAFRKINRLHDWCDGTVGSHPVNSEDWLDLEDALFDSTVVETQRRLTVEEQRQIHDALLDSVEVEKPVTVKVLTADEMRRGVRSGKSPE